MGATILKVCKGVQKILVGGNQKGKLFLKMKKYVVFQNQFQFFKDLSIIDFDCFIYSVGGVCDNAADRIVEAVGAGACQSRGKTAILSRCNFGVFSEAVRLTDANPSCRLHFIGVSVYPHIIIRRDALRCGLNLIKNEDFIVCYQCM